MLLVLLLAVRVAASPAIQCQHELAAQTARTAQAVTGIPYSVGDLCGLPLVGDGPEHDENVLNSLCPFFMAPGILPASEVVFGFSDQVYSWSWPLPAAVHSGTDAAIAGYEARAPPIGS
ncbi:hypothetical protein PEL8287_02367 [Roseovarius litorisediminis]|uniref:Uncharacterized protein n=2 Tax=Roseovarius litorisediminis TaxID=1312363 RepID=A0A1Y5SV29_9RHOB|nr:hypothetical protein PEL8287_02367 [Roseovarius litorisediminis]